MITWHDHSASCRCGGRIGASQTLGTFNVEFEDLLLFDLVEHTSRRITTHGTRLTSAAQLDPTGDIDGVVRAGPATGEEPHLLIGHEGAIASHRSHLRPSAGKPKPNHRQLAGRRSTFGAGTARKEGAMAQPRVMVLVVVLLGGAAMAMGQTEWVEYPDNPVLGPGAPGEWDAGVRLAIAVHFDGSVYHLWFSGGRTLSGPLDIGHATSPDRVDWAMDPANPVLIHGAPGEWDDSLLFGAGLVHDGAQYHMWYAGFGTQVGFWQGGYATSPDGTVWTKHPGNPVLTPGAPGAWDDQNIFPFSAILEGDTYRMWYDGSGSHSGQVGYAKSSDGVTWTRHPDPVLEFGRSPGAWDSPFATNPSVVFDGSTYHMLYGGGGYGEFWSLGYAFSSDGLAWTKHRDNPVYSVAEGGTAFSPVYFDGTTFHLWCTHEYPDQTMYIEYATSDCCAGVAAFDNSRFIPAAAVAEGSEGAFFQTDVDVSNADDRTAEYRFQWLPRGEDNSEPVTSETFTLGAGMSVRYANVLTEVFDLEPNSFGALHIQSTSPDLLAMSRIYNVPGAKQAGTYGQAMPAIRPDELIAGGEWRRIVFATENDTMRTNIGCLNATGDTVVVTLDLVASDGTALERRYLILWPWGNDQLNRILNDYRPITGAVDLWIDQPGVSFYCYGSVLDNVTSDPTTIPPQ